MANHPLERLATQGFQGNRVGMGKRFRADAAEVV